jgi:hypothetical protein
MPLIFFKFNEVGHFIAKCPNRSENDRNDKNDFKYRKDGDYNDKGKKSCYIAEEEYTKSSFDDDKEVVKMVYVAINQDPNGERYERETTLISHVSKNDSWILDNGFSHHMIGDLSKCNKFEEIDYG